MLWKPSAVQSSESGAQLAGPYSLVAITPSSSSGTQFDGAGRFNHIFRSETGGSADRYLGVSVVVPTATVMDGAVDGVLPYRSNAVLRDLGASAAWFDDPHNIA